ncbi:MAG: hydrolase [Lachnospiraceae bacterium]|nr:hydrolase [Lachnospiraceae bacterium]
MSEEKELQEALSEKKEEGECPAKKFRCPCCGYYTLEEVGAYEVCPVCYWEDDPSQESDPESEGGANELSLIESQRNFKLYGACEERYVKYVRGPLLEEMEDE